MEQHNHLKGLGFVLFSVLIWSGWVVVSRFGVKGSLTPYDITAIRFTVSGLILLPVVLRRGLAIGPWGYKSSFLLSLLMGACYSNIVIMGMRFAPVSHASTVNSGTFLVLTTLIGMHGLHEHISKLRLTGVLCSLCGIALMLAAKGDAPSGQQWLGHVLFMVGGSMWAVYAALARAWKLEPLHAASVLCVFSMLTYMPFYLLFADHHIGPANLREVALQGVYQGALTGVVALISFNIGVGMLGAARAGSLIPLIPALSSLIAMPVLHEYPSVTEWVGIGAVSVGVGLASGAISWRWGRHKKQPD